MPAKRISMRKIRDVLRLHGHAHLSRRQIARSLGLAHSTVCDYLYRAQAAGLSWPLPDELNEAALERLLFPKPAPSRRARPQPNWAEVDRELASRCWVRPRSATWAELRARLLLARGHAGEALAWAREARRRAPWRSELAILEERCALPR